MIYEFCFANTVWLMVGWSESDMLKFYLWFQINSTARFFHFLLSCHINFYRGKLARIWKSREGRIISIFDLKPQTPENHFTPGRVVAIENLHTQTNHKLHHPSKSCLYSLRSQQWWWKFPLKLSIIAANLLPKMRASSSTDIWWDKSIQFSSS